MCGNLYNASRYNRLYCIECQEKRTLESSNGYNYIWEAGKYQSEHKLIYEKAHGEIPNGYIIHHIDKNRRNNNISNLIAIPSRDHLKLHKRGSGSKCIIKKKGVKEVPKQELLSVREAAEVLGVSTMTVRNYCRQGRIDAFKVHRDWRIINKDEWWLDLNNGHKKGE